MDYHYFNKLSAKQKLLLKACYPVNWLCRKLNLNIEIAAAGDDNDMITIEQRINLFHLLNEVLVHNIEGDVIELGCHVGNSAMQIQSMLEEFNSSKQFHVYDKFNLATNSFNGIKDIFKANFNKKNLRIPQIHEGLFTETIPSQLPAKLSFIHIDAGYGGDKDKFTELILHLLKHVYQRMSENSICLLMDYHDISKTVKGMNANPGVKAACDLFFEDKPENIYVLYGNQFSHGYFRKK